MIAMALDRARTDGYDVAYLFSDIAPRFYAQLGFRELPSRQIVLRADALPADRLPMARLRRAIGAACAAASISASAIAPRDSCARPWSGSGSACACATARSAGPGKRRIWWYAGDAASRAYVLGVRDAERDTYALAEFGFADATAALAIPALLRAAAGDLRRVAGWLPPNGARELLPRGSVRKRKSSVLMAAPLTAAGTRLIKSALAPRSADFCWTTDHI